MLFSLLPSVVGKSFTMTQDKKKPDNGSNGSFHNSFEQLRRRESVISVNFNEEDPEEDEYGDEVSHCFTQHFMMYIIQILY